MSLITRNSGSYFRYATKNTKNLNNYLKKYENFSCQTLETLRSKPKNTNISEIKNNLGKKSKLDNSKTKMFALATLAAVVIAVGVLATKGKIKLPQKLKNVVDTIRCNFNKPLNALPNKNIDIFQIIKENGMSLVDGKLSKADYKKLIMKYHPDRNLDNIEFATEILKKLKALKP